MTIRNPNAPETKDAPSPLHGHVLELDVKALSETGEFEGYASVFGNEDQGGDVVMRGAFAKSIARGAGKVKMLAFHDSRKVIGVWTELAEDQKGLKAKGKLILDTTLGRETHTLLKHGALDGLSIGYRTVKSHFDHAKLIRYLDEVELREISVVTFPMNDRATIANVKGGLPTEREFEQWLMRDAGFTAQQAKTIVASGYKALKGERDAAGSEGELVELINRATQAFR